MVRKPTVVITHTVFEETAHLLEKQCRLVLNPTDETLPRQVVLRRAQAADGLMAFMPDYVDDAFLAQCPDLRIIACALKGYDNFDADACTRHGVWLTVVPDLLTVPTAELAIGLALALARNVPAGDRWVRSGDFQGWLPRFYGTGLADSTVGIVGMGRVGRAVAQRLAAFGARIVHADPADTTTAAHVPGTGKVLPMESLLGLSDFVILCVPLNDSSLGMIGRGALTRLRPGAYLVNVGRGSVVDEEAVADALESGALAGYAADVFAFEDWQLPGRPRAVPERLLALRDRTLFTPHLGSAVVAARKAIERSGAESLLAVFDGRPPPGAVNRIAPVTAHVYP